MSGTVWDQPTDSRPRILVAAPTYRGCGYALRAWADAYKAFTYPNKGALMVDNSDENLHYSHLVRAQEIDCIYQERRFSFIWDTLELAWRRIVEYAHDEGYDMICSIEADIICPPETLDVLLREYEAVGGNAIVSHRYHPRGYDNPVVPEGAALNKERLIKAKPHAWFDTLGCVLFPVDYLYACRNRWMAIFESEIYLQAEDAGLQRVRLKDLLDIKHLEDPDRYEQREGQMPPPNSSRLHPAVLTVEHAPETPPDTGWHGRRDASQGQPGVTPQMVEQERHIVAGEVRPEDAVLENVRLRQTMSAMMEEIKRLRAEKNG